MRNIFVSTEEENFLFHAETLTPEECGEFVRRSAKLAPVDSVEVSGDMIQYHCIDNRMTLTASDEIKIRNIIANVCSPKR